MHQRYFVNVVFSQTQKVFAFHALCPADAICMAIDILECDGVDLKSCGTMAIVAKPDDGANGYMASVDYTNRHTYEVTPCAA